MLQGQIWPLTFSNGALHMPPHMDDVALVTGLQQGDARVVEYAVEMYAPALYRFAYYQLQDAAAAEDLVSEVLARVVSRIGGFDLREANFQSWVYRIARNLIADHYRSRKRRPQISLDAMIETEPESEPQRNDPAIQNILDREQLREGLAALTLEQRQVILLHVIEGWELPQVARLLDRSVPSVKSLYYRGVQSLRQALARAGDSLEGEAG